MPHRRARPQFSVGKRIGIGEQLRASGNFRRRIVAYFLGHDRVHEFLKSRQRGILRVALN